MGCFPRAIYEAPKKERNTSVKQPGRFCGAAVSVHDVTDIGRGRTKITMPQYRRTDIDYKELIERLNNAAGGGPAGRKMCQDAAKAITDLLIRAEKAERERDTLIKRTSGDCWSCIRRYECNSRRGPHNRCWEFDNWLLKEDK